MITLYPAIDLQGGQAVRLRQGDFAQTTVFSDDPVDQAKRFADEGAQSLHVVDLDGARAGEPVHAALVASIAAAFPGTVHLGGGLRSRAAIETALATGVDRVVVGTAVVDDAGREGGLDRGPRAQPAAKVHGSREGGRDARDQCRVHRLPGAGTVEVDDVERRGALVGEALRLVDGVVAEHRGLGEVALPQADGLAVLQVDRRVEGDHAAAGRAARTPASPRPSRPRPAALDFSGWNWTPCTPGRPAAAQNATP